MFVAMLFVPRVGHKSGYGACDVPIDLHNLLNSSGLHKRRSDPLFDGQDYTFGSADTNRCRPQFDGLNGVLHLEQPPLRAECVDTAVIFRSS